MFGFCCGGPWSQGWWSNGWWGGGWMMFLFWIFWLLLIGAGVWLIISVIRRIRSQPSLSASSPVSARSAGETAQDILKSRYARGEITREEFEEMRRAIAD